jgi:hypothetical protein
MRKGGKYANRAIVRAASATRPMVTRIAAISIVRLAVKFF